MTSSTCSLSLAFAEGDISEHYNFRASLVLSRCARCLEYLCNGEQKVRRDFGIIIIALDGIFCTGDILFYCGNFAQEVGMIPGWRYRPVFRTAEFGSQIKLGLLFYSRYTLKMATQLHLPKTERGMKRMLTICGQLLFLFSIN